MAGNVLLDSPYECDRTFARSDLPAARYDAADVLRDLGRREGRRRLASETQAAADCRAWSSQDPGGPRLSRWTRQPRCQPASLTTHAFAYTKHVRASKWTKP